ncbi:hypothetical protein ATL41_2297 [Flavimobilis soli]|uniref:Glyoxalase/bleomycin resistance protein/dioxygenase superfamily protein n=1 Tax=Flavimobilis soli TaxID=442709 RepID=A0A2A9EH24_9MICO|nr:hypothetical protein ATL41_2297 [Flavimobilis soli]
MQPRVTVVTLGVADVPRSRRFYVDGYRWEIAVNPDWPDLVPDDS